MQPESGNAVGVECGCQEIVSPSLVKAVQVYFSISCWGLGQQSMQVGEKKNQKKKKTKKTYK